MKKVYLSVCTVLFVVCEADCSAYFSERSSKVIAPPLVPIAKTQQITNSSKVIKIEPQEQKRSPEAIVKEILWDGRSFADVVKGVKKSDTSKSEKKSKKENKSRKKLEKSLQPNSNSRKDFHDVWKTQQSNESKFNNKKLSAKGGVNKRRQSAHKGNLYRSR